MEEKIRALLEEIKRLRNSESYAVIDVNCIEFVVGDGHSIEICGRDALTALSVLLDIPVDHNLP